MWYNNLARKGCGSDAETNKVYACFAQELPNSERTVCSEHVRLCTCLSSENDCEEEEAWRSVYGVDFLFFFWLTFDLQILGNGNLSMYFPLEFPLFQLCSTTRPKCLWTGGYMQDIQNTSSSSFPKTKPAITVIALFVKFSRRKYFFRRKYSLLLTFFFW